VYEIARTAAAASDPRDVKMDMDVWGKELLDELDKTGVADVDVEDGDISVDADDKTDRTPDVEGSTTVPGELHVDASTGRVEGVVRKRPPGRPPKNKVWDPYKGQYVPRVLARSPARNDSSGAASAGVVGGGIVGSSTHASSDVIAPAAAHGHGDSTDVLMHQSMEVNEPSKAPGGTADSVASVNGASCIGAADAMEVNESGEAPGGTADSVASFNGASCTGAADAMEVNEPGEAPGGTADSVASFNGASCTGAADAMEVNEPGEAPYSAADIVATATATADGASGSGTTAASADIVHAAASSGSASSSAMQVDEVEADPKVSEVRGELGCLRNTREALRNNKKRLCDDDDEDALESVLVDLKHVKV
jgi:hypothetical protein